MYIVPARTRFDGRLLCDKQNPVRPHPSLSFHLTPLSSLQDISKPFVSSCFLSTHSSHSLCYPRLLIRFYVFQSRCTNVGPVTSSSATARTAMLTWTNTTIGWNVRPALDNFGLRVAASSTWMRLITGNQPLNVKPAPVPSLRRLLPISI